MENLKWSCYGLGLSSLSEKGALAPFMDVRQTVVRLHSANLGPGRCKHHKAHPICKKHVVLHHLQGVGRRYVEGGDAFLKLVDGFRHTTKVSNNRVVEGDLQWESLS